jgi:hypothetical protein
VSFNRTAWRLIVYSFWKAILKLIQIQNTKQKGKAILVQTLRVPGGRGSQNSIPSAHEGGKVFSPKHRPPLHPRKNSWYSFLLRAASTPGPRCGHLNLTRDLLACNPQPSVLPPGQTNATMCHCNCDISRRWINLFTYTVHSICNVYFFTQEKGKWKILTVTYRTRNWSKDLI